MKVPRKVVEEGKQDVQNVCEWMLMDWKLSQMAAVVERDTLKDKLEQTELSGSM